MGETNKETTLCYADGVWNRGYDPVGRSWSEGVSLDAAISAAGYELWARIGDPAVLVNAPITVTIHHRPQEPRYLVCVEGLFGPLEWVYARALPDLMDLLAKWTPAVQFAFVTDLLCQLNDPHGGDSDVIRLLRRLLRQGEDY
ncbi:hypothetical protein KIK06_10350 [Nocardiopsis sp. EMB25]|uniref:hypothetical protein n=1 Tax=Nocardiopsis sp. EMB25 TaxID=2835867 RepID=UPI002283BC4D|nr:hypothetical protein [Nocardiopsis sp. EMB25]MCY9784292.1 hypothetical protein [Nocardiopsis sp. EMB25]